MVKSEGARTQERRGLWAIAVTTGTLALVAAGCGNNSERADVPAPLPTVTQPAKESALTFDDLGGGSSIIEVYPGVGNTPEDRAFNGTYNDGDTVGAECKEEGREVHSHPEAGEEDRNSDEWIRITGTPGNEQFATAVYIEHPTKVLSELPPC